MTELGVSILLVVVVIEDLRRFRIRNLLVGLLAAAFIVACLERGESGLILPHGVFAAVAFALLALAFHFRLIGGGDAKLLTVALLWVGLEGAFVFAAILLALTLVTIAGARLGLVPSRRTARGTKIPFGPSIAGAWLAVIGLSHVVQAGDPDRSSQIRAQAVFGPVFNAR